jgi:hypothetical protein
MRRKKFKSVNKMSDKRRSNLNSKTFKSAKPYHWLPVPFGKHIGKTLPELLINDPSYFFWALAKGIFLGKLSHQAQIVAARARHVLPPISEPNDHQYAMRFNERGKLESVAIMKMAPDLGDVLPLRHFDFSVFCLLGRREAKTKVKILNWLKGELFGREGPISQEACEAFLSDDDNFDLTCQELHGMPMCAVG